MSSDEELLNESDEEVLTRSDIWKMINTMWQNEISSPTLLQPQSEIIDLFMEEVEKKESEMDTESGDKYVKDLEKINIQRIKFVITDYLRLRIRKIEEFCEFYLTDGKNYLTREEKRYALLYQQSVWNYLNDTVVGKTFPGRDFNLANFITPPNIDSIVFCRAVESVDISVKDSMDANAEDSVLSYAPGDQFLMPFRWVEHLVKNRSVALI